MEDLCCGAEGGDEGVGGGGGEKVLRGEVGVRVVRPAAAELLLHRHVEDQKPCFPSPEEDLMLQRSSRAGCKYGNRTTPRAGELCACMVSVDTGSLKLLLLTCSCLV